MIFMCRCDEKGEQECENLLSEVKERLNIKNDRDLLGSIVASLGWNFDVHISGIYVDQWFGVEAERFNLDTKEYDDKIFVQCDDPIDGLTAVWKYYADKYGDTSED